MDLITVSAFRHTGVLFCSWYGFEHFFLVTYLFVHAFGCLNFRLVFVLGMLLNLFFLVTYLFVHAVGCHNFRLIFVLGMLWNLFFL